MTENTIDPANLHAPGAARPSGNAGQGFLHETLPGSLRQIQGTARDGTEYLKTQGDQAADAVRHYPLLAIAVAAGAGYMVGRLLGR